jgi:hypothetical protein
MLLRKLSSIPDTVVGGGRSSCRPSRRRPPRSAKEISVLISFPSTWKALKALEVDQHVDQLPLTPLTVARFLGWTRKDKESGFHMKT